MLGMKGILAGYGALGSVQQRERRDAAMTKSIACRDDGIAIIFFKVDSLRETLLPAMSGKRAFLELLKQEGVEIMFGNPGTTELPLMDALAVENELRRAFGAPPGQP